MQGTVTVVPDLLNVRSTRK